MQLSDVRRNARISRRTHAIIISIILAILTYVSIPVHADDDGSGGTFLIIFKLNQPPLSAAAWSALDTTCQTELTDQSMLDIGPVSGLRLKLVNYVPPEAQPFNNSQLISFYVAPCQFDFVTCFNTTSAAHASQEFISLYTRKLTLAGASLIPPVVYSSAKADRFWNLQCLQGADATFQPILKTDQQCVLDNCIDTKGEEASATTAKLVILLVAFIVVVLICACIIFVGNQYVDRKNKGSANASSSNANARGSRRTSANGASLGIPSALPSTGSSRLNDLHHHGGLDGRAIEIEMDERQGDSDDENMLIAEPSQQHRIVSKLGSALASSDEHSEMKE